MRFAAAFVWVFAGFILGLVIVGTQWLQAHDPAPSDDGWRRTSAGWERVELWAAPKRPAAAVPIRKTASEASMRYDFHPAYLVLFQVAAVWAAFLVFRATRRTTAEKQAR
jgi:hypothetical protein